jgi:hypothetical protein
MSGQLPVQVPTKLVVLMAFDRAEDGELRPAWEAREMPSEERAIRAARELAHLHAGVIAWSREADIAMGEYGPSEELFRHGQIPDLD